MAFDPTPIGSGGGDPYEALCSGCRQPIREGQRSVKVAFASDPHGHDGLTGLYHEPCGRLFKSLAHVVNLNPWSKF
jgi:hypothetical protein